MDKRKTKIIFVSISIGIILLVSNYFGFDKNIKNAFFLVSEPTQKLFWQKGQSLNLFLETLGEIKDLKNRNEKLELKNQELKAEIAKLNGLKNENETLRKALNLELEKEFQLLMADVAGKDPFSDTLLINRGSGNGVAVGSPVITPEKILIGRVEEVFSNFSRVNLLSNKKSSVGAQVQAENEEIVGLARGQGGFKITFDLIPQDKKIQIGNLLVTTALGGLFPKGLLIGEIVRIDDSDVKPFQTAQVEPAFDVENLKTLFVITKFEE